MQNQYFGPSTQGRHPRTLQEAFGPYETGPVVDPKATREGWPWFVAVLSCGLAAVVITLCT